MPSLPTESAIVKNARFAFLTIAGAILLTAYSANLAKAYDMATHSVSDSKLHGYFIQNVDISPAEFHWEGHTVKVHESWLEGDRGKKTKSMFMLFVKFKIDDSLTNEQKIWHTDKRQLVLMLSDPKSFDHYSMHLPVRLWIKAIAGGSYGEVVHGFPFSKTPKEPLKLTVCTNGYPRNKKPVKSDVQLTCTIAQR